MNNIKEISELAKNREDSWATLGDFYYKKNIYDCINRRKWLAKIIILYRPTSVLEIGCNEGANLREIKKFDPNCKIAGIDINVNAIKYAQSTLPEAKIVWGSIYDLDKYFKRKEFDLVFSMGTLIHIPPEMLAQVKGQVVYLTKNIILHCEEHLEKPEVKRWDNNIPHRWTHNYFDLYKGYNAKIYRAVFGASSGAHHLIIVKLASKPIELKDRLRLQYFTFLLPLIYKYSERIKTRYKVRGLPYFFLPATKNIRKKFKTK